jgi:hypothetical protein
MAQTDFTIADVLAWARTKPADERYCFTSSGGCALGQFAREMRGFSLMVAARGGYNHLVSRELFDAAQGAYPRFKYCGPDRLTFGAFVRRLETLAPAPVSETWSAIDAYLTDIELASA